MSCQVCYRKSKSACSKCHFVYYCGKEHQQNDWKRHSVLCKPCSRAEINMKSEEERLRNLPEDYFFIRAGTDLFRDQRGHFWGIHETRDFMRSRWRYVLALTKLGTPQSLNHALSLSLDCLDLNRGDSLGFRDEIPNVMLRLNKVQECYDFIKWWATCDPDGHYDWGNTALPYLNLQNEDVLEELSEELLSMNTRQTLSLALTKHQVFILLKRMEEMQTLILTTFRQKRIANPNLRKIRDYLFDSTGYENIFRTIDKQKQSISEWKSYVKQQRNDLLMIAFSKNPYLIEFRTREFQTTADPAYMSEGSKEEAILTMKSCYEAWNSTESGLFILDNYPLYCRICCKRFTELKTYFSHTSSSTHKTIEKSELEEFHQDYQEDDIRKLLLQVTDKCSSCGDWPVTITGKCPACSTENDLY